MDKGRDFHCHKNDGEEPDMVPYTCNPSMWKVKKGRLWLWGKPEQSSEFLPSIGHVLYIDSKKEGKKCNEA